MSHVSEIVERVRAHIVRPEVAGFTIGYSSGPPERRVRGSDHRDHARTECMTLAEGLTRQQALDLAALTRRLSRRFWAWDSRVLPPAFHFTCKRRMSLSFLVPINRLMAVVGLNLRSSAKRWRRLGKILG